MTLKAPRPKRGHTRRPPRKSRPYQRTGKPMPRWKLDSLTKFTQAAKQFRFYPASED